MTNEWIIRLARRQELDEIVSLWKDLMDLTAEVNVHYRLRTGAVDYQRNIFEEYLRREDSYILVGLLNERVIAFSNGYLTMPAKTFVQSPLGVLENLFVVAAHRRQGYGQALAEAAIRWLANLGAAEIFVNVIPKNLGSLKFWRAMGFDVQRLAMIRRP